jgi:hypothetical protein
MVYDANNLFTLTTSMQVVRDVSSLFYSNQSVLLALFCLCLAVLSFACFVFFFWCYDVCGRVQ